MTVEVVRHSPRRRCRSEDRKRNRTGDFPVVTTATAASSPMLHPRAALVKTPNQRRPESPQNRFAEADPGRGRGSIAKRGVKGDLKGSGGARVLRAAPALGIRARMRAMSLGRKTPEALQLTPVRRARRMDA